MGRILDIFGDSIIHRKMVPVKKKRTGSKENKVQMVGNIITTHRPCQFSDHCMRCIARYECISATRATYDLRKFVLSLRNQPIYSLETKKLFQKGIANHQERQKDIKSVEQMGYKTMRKSVLNHERTVISEAKVCSPLMRLHGVIDILAMQFNNNRDLEIWIDELKSTFSKKHYLQLGAYAMILSDPNAKIVVEEPMKRKPKNSRKLYMLYPGAIRYMNIKGRIFIFSFEKEQHYWEMVAMNQYFESSGNIKLAIEKKLRRFREIMLKRAIDARTVPYCINCREENRYRCGWNEICAKIQYDPKLRQMYMSQNKIRLQKEDILVKTR